METCRWWTAPRLSFALALCGVVFAVGMGSIELFDLDELYFAEISREMMESGAYGQVRFRFEPLYEKPPLFFWMQAASMRLWGIHAWGARFPNLVCGLATLATLYAMGRKAVDKRFGALWAWVYFGTFLPHFYIKSGIMDPWFNYFMLCSIWFLVRASSQNGVASSLGAAICMGVALLIKGPIGVAIPVASMLLANRLFPGRLRLKSLLGSSLCAGCLFGLWLLPEIKRNGWTFVGQFGEYHWVLCKSFTDTHAHPWYYHGLVLFWGCFPSSLFALGWLVRNRGRADSHFAASMQAVGCVVLLLFSAVGTKIVHYSSMAYFPIAFFAARLLREAMESDLKRSARLGFGWLLGGSVLAALLLLLPWLMRHKALWLACVHNENALHALQLPIPWSWRDGVPGMAYLVGLALSLRFFVRKRWSSFAWSVMGTQAVVLNLFLLQVGPKIQRYAQKDLSDFCRSLRHQDVYLATVGFKAAAPLFYTHRREATCLQEGKIDWLLQGKIDKPCFFVAYKSDEKLFAPHADVVRVQASGCFVFYRRSPQMVQAAAASSGAGSVAHAAGRQALAQPMP